MLSWRPAGPPPPELITPSPPTAANEPDAAFDMLAIEVMLPSELFVDFVKQILVSGDVKVVKRPACTRIPDSSIVKVVGQIFDA